MTLSRSNDAAMARTAEALRLRDEGLTIAQIAQQLGCSEVSVYRYVGPVPGSTQAGISHDFPRKPYDPDLAWQADALCVQVDSDLFFPDKGGSAREAKSICAGCPVTAECLAYALRNDERFGVWGGLSERERRHIKPGRPS